MFNCHKTLADSGEVDFNMSRLFLFSPSIADRPEEINQYLTNVSTAPLDVTKKQLDIWAGGDFDPSKREHHHLETEKIKKAVVKAIEHIASASNSNLVRNADGILCRKSSEIEVEWLNGVKRNIPEKCKRSY